MIIIIIMLWHENFSVIQGVIAWYFNFLHCGREAVKLFAQEGLEIRFRDAQNDFGGAK